MIKYEAKKFLYNYCVLNSCVSDQINNAQYITADLIDPENPPVINFDETIFNFDTVALGSKVEHTFIFTNKGSTPLAYKFCKSRMRLYGTKRMA